MLATIFFQTLNLVLIIGIFYLIFSLPKKLKELIELVKRNNQEIEQIKELLKDNK